MGHFPPPGGNETSGRPDLLGMNEGDAATCPDTTDAPSASFRIRPRRPPTPRSSRITARRCSSTWACSIRRVPSPRRSGRPRRGLLERAIPAGEWTGWIAEDGHGVLGGGAALLRVQPPGPDCPAGGESAYLLNFYTEPRARRRGVATALVRACLAWCGSRGVARVSLHASAAGRHVYERLGFGPARNRHDLEARSGGTAMKRPTMPRPIRRWRR